MTKRFYKPASIEVCRRYVVVHSETGSVCYADPHTASIVYFALIAMGIPFRTSLWDLWDTRMLTFAESEQITRERLEHGL